MQPPDACRRAGVRACARREQIAGPAPHASHASATPFAPAHPRHACARKTIRARRMPRLKMPLPNGWKVKKDMQGKLGKVIGYRGPGGEYVPKARWPAKLAELVATDLSSNDNLSDSERSITPPADPVELLEAGGGVPHTVDNGIDQSQPMLVDPPEPLADTTAGGEGGAPLQPANGGANGQMVQEERTGQESVRTDEDAVGDAGTTGGADALGDADAAAMVDAASLAAAGAPLDAQDPGGRTAPAHEDVDDDATVVDDGDATVVDDGDALSDAPTPARDFASLAREVTGALDELRETTAQLSDAPVDDGLLASVSSAPQALEKHDELTKLAQGVGECTLHKAAVHAKARLAVSKARALKAAFEAKQLVDEAVGALSDTETAIEANASESRKLAEAESKLAEAEKKLREVQQLDPFLVAVPTAMADVPRRAAQLGAQAAELQAFLDVLKVVKGAPKALAVASEELAAAVASFDDKSQAALMARLGGLPASLGAFVADAASVKAVYSSSLDELQATLTQSQKRAQFGGLAASQAERDAEARDQALVTLTNIESSVQKVVDSLAEHVPGALRECAPAHLRDLSAAFDRQGPKPGSFPAVDAFIRQLPLPPAPSPASPRMPSASQEQMPPRTEPARPKRTFLQMVFGVKPSAAPFGSPSSSSSSSSSLFSSSSSSSSSSSMKLA